MSVKERGGQYGLQISAVEEDITGPAADIKHMDTGSETDRSEEATSQWISRLSGAHRTICICGPSREMGKNALTRAASMSAITCHHLTREL
jgi:hypothetical protein